VEDVVHGEGGHGPTGFERLQPEEIPAVDVLAVTTRFRALLTANLLLLLRISDHANIP
jgi:hypothetical protein